MRTLKFIVDSQLIKPDLNCDFSGLIPGTEGYLKAEFSFSSEWDGCVKVVEFRSLMGKEYTPQILKDGKTCMIPAAALALRRFNMQVIGKREHFKILTNRITVDQNGGGT